MAGIMGIDTSDLPSTGPGASGASSAAASAGPKQLRCGSLNILTMLVLVNSVWMTYWSSYLNINTI